VPLDSPILQRALDQVVPEYPAQLLATVALLEAAGHPTESATLARQVERAQLLALLGQPPAPPTTVASLIAPSPTTGTTALPAIGALRACVASTAIGLDFPEGATMSGSYQPAGHDTWRSVTGELYVPVRIANQAAAALTTATFSVRLVPLQGGPPVALFIDRSGGAPIDGHQSAQAHAYVDARTGGVDAATLDRVIDGMRRGDYRVELTDWRLRFEAGEQLTLTPRGMDWDDPTLRVTGARLALKAAPCADVAGCGAARSGKGLSSPYGWIFGECLLALVAGVLLARRHESRRLALAGYTVYACLAFGAAGLALFDPPTGSGMSGILSVGSSFMLGLPWSLSLANPASKGALLGHLFTAPDADLMAGWVGMAVNQAILGLLAFWRVGRGDNPSPGA
jgi:hypothetical protein